MPRAMRLRIYRFNLQGTELLAYEVVLGLADHFAARCARRRLLFDSSFLAFFPLLPCSFKSLGLPSLALARRPSKMIDSGDLMLSPGSRTLPTFLPGSRRQSRLRFRTVADMPSSFPFRPASVCASAAALASCLTPRTAAGGGRADVWLRRPRSVARAVLCGALQRLTRNSRGRSGGNFFPARRSAASTELPSCPRLAPGRSMRTG